MAINRSIRQTLLQKLFIKPSPLVPSEYRKAKELLFPSRDIFISFLESDDDQQRQLFAKEIIDLLVFTFQSSAPTRLLRNLHALQNVRPVAVRDGDYIPQDHFVHLVHLYLLGLFIFSYSSFIHRKCVQEILNSVKKHASITSFKGFNSNRYVLFSKLWVHFVLYHDLGYPLERIYPANREESKILLEPFKVIHRAIRKDMSLQIISKLVTLFAILNDDPTRTLESLFLSHYDGLAAYFPESNVEIDLALVGNKPDRATSTDINAGNILQMKRIQELQHTLKLFRKAQYISTIEGLSTLNMVLAFFLPGSLIAVLEDESLGAPIAIIPGSCRDDKHSPYVLIKDNLSRCLRSKRVKELLPLVAFGKIEAPYKSAFLKWRFFISEPTKTLIKQLEPILGEKRVQIISNIALKTESEFDVSRSRRRKLDSAPDISFAYYKMLNKAIGYYRDEEDVEQVDNSFDEITKAFLSISKQLPQLIGEAAAKVMENEIANLKAIGKKRKKRLATITIAEHVLAEEYAEVILPLTRDDGKAMVDMLKSKIDETMRKKLRVEEDIKSCMQFISDEILAKLDENHQAYDAFKDCDFNTPPKDGCGKYFCLKGIFSGNELEFKQVETHIKHIANEHRLRLCEFVGAYLPKWAKNEPNFRDGGFIDHGFASCLIMLSSLSLYDRWLAYIGECEKGALRDERALRLLNIGLGISSSNEIQWQGLKNILLRDLIVNTVFHHNIQADPVFAKIKNLKDPVNVSVNKISVNAHPIMYLAVLADGIQRWDRLKLVNLAKSNIDIKSFTPGSKFDIRIDKDSNIIELYIAGRDSRADFEELQAGLSKVLKEAESLLEYKPM
jgi:hypothetical protein